MPPRYQPNPFAPNYYVGPDAVGQDYGTVKHQYQPDPSKPNYYVGADAIDDRIDIGKELGVVPNWITPGSPGGSLDTTQADQQRNNTGALISLLQQQAATGDGAWQGNFAKAVSAAKGNAAALGQSENAQARSGYAGALRNIGNAQGAVGQRAVGQEQILRNQTREDAQGQLAEILGAQGQGDISQAGTQAAVAQQAREANLALQDQAIQQQMATNKAGNQIASYVPGASKGGRVPGKPKVFGDDERNDTQPAMLSPGEIVVPRSAAGDPDKAAAFARAVAAHHGAKRLADGGVPDSPDTGTQVGIGLLSTIDPGAGAAWLRGHGIQAADPSVGNGGLLDTTNFAQTRGQSDALAGQLGARAAGGDSIAGTINQQQNDAAFAQAARAQNERRAVMSDVLQANAEQGSKTAGEAGERSGREQSKGQRALGALDLERRAQELALAKEQQKAGWTNTLINHGISLQNQAALRGMLASAGHGAAALSSMGGRGSIDAGGGGDTEGDASSAADNDFDLEAGSFGDETGDGGGDSDASSAQTNDSGGMAHGGRVTFARAARMARGGKAGDVAHLTILIPAPPPAMVVGDGHGLAQAARRMAGGGKLTGKAVAPRDTEAEEGDGDDIVRAKRPAPLPPPSDAAYQASLDAAGAAKLREGQRRPQLGYHPRPAPEPHEEPVVQRAYGGNIPGYADGGAAVEQGPLEKLAQAVQAGARIAKGYADGGEVRGYSGEAGYPEDQVVTPDAGVSAPMTTPAQAHVLFTPAAAADAGTTAIPQASFQPAGTTGLDRRGPNGEMVPWEKSIENQATVAPPAKLPPMRPPATTAPAPSIAKPVTSTPRPAIAVPAPVAPDSFDEGMKALRQEGELKAQQAADLAKAQGAYQAQLQKNSLEQSDIMKRAHEDASAVMGRYNDAVEQMKHIDTTIDPGRFWASRTTGQKVMGIIGMALSALGSRDGTNRAADLLGKAIDRDVDAQKAEVEARLKRGEGAISALQTAYAMNRQLFQNDLAASAATKASLLDLSINQAEQIKTAYAGKLSGPEADALVAQLKQARDKYLQQAQSQVVENNLKRGQTAEAYARAAAAGQKGSGLTPERQKAIDDVESATRNIRDNLQKARAIVREYGTAEVTGPQEGELKRALIDVAQDAARLKDPGSTVREGELAAQKAALGFQGGEWVTPTNATALKLLDSYEKGIEARRANAYAARKLQPPSVPMTQSQLEE